jgi:hypothetical protein
MLPSIFFRKGASGFSWASTADQVTQGLSAAGLTAIVTGNAPPLPLSLPVCRRPSFRFGLSLPTPGASSGIGAETARVLAARGAHVVMAARNVAAADSVRQAVLADTPASTLDVMELDLSSMASVRKFAADFSAKGLPLNILVYAPSAPNSHSTTPVHFHSYTPSPCASKALYRFRLEPFGFG